MDASKVMWYILREVLGLVGMGIALFWSAGTLYWWPAWSAMAVMAGWVVSTGLILFRFNPALLAERMGPRKGAKKWDILIMSFVGSIQLARYIIAGLDKRFRWSGEFPFWVQIGALVICALSYSLFVWSMATNTFFSKIVRIQTERGHAVITGGPYRFVRHPAYLGGILYEIFVSLLLSSWWSLIAGTINMILLITRTALEDRMLGKELAGYQQYSQKTKFRILPGIW